MGWSRHTVDMGKTRNAHRILVRKPKQKGILGKQKYSRKIIRNETGGYRVVKSNKLHVNTW